MPNDCMQVKHDNRWQDRRMCAGVDVVVRYDIHEIAEYINWSYFFHAWDFPHEYSSISGVHSCAACRQAWLDAFPEDKRPKAMAAAELYDDARRLLSELDGRFGVNALFMLCDEACADGDDIMLGEVRLPMLRQQTPGTDGYCRCLSDYVNPAGNDRVGVFAASADAGIESYAPQDDYVKLLSQTLADRLAEAAAERLHEEVRKNLWGYAPDESLTVAEMHAEKFQGLRPAVGYPCMPDMSVNMLLDELCDFSRIGVVLTESGMMRPHASVSGLMISHPQARYFSVGCILDDQLEDYAGRRGLPVEEMRRFLAKRYFNDNDNVDV